MKGTIDEKDLRQASASEIKPGATFYLRTADGYERCSIDPDEIKDPGRALELRTMTKQYSQEGRIFVRINKPFQSFMV